MTAPDGDRDRDGEGYHGDRDRDRDRERTRDRDEEVGSGGRVFASPAARRQAAVRALVVGGVVVLASAALSLAFPNATDPAWLRSRLGAFGPFAPPAFVALQAVQVVLAPVPGQVLGGVGGYLFGVVPGTVYSLTGVVLGSAVAFAATRRYGRPYVERVVDPGALARWDDLLERHGVPGLFVLFLLPTFPDDVLCFAAGLSTLRLRTFLALVVVGRGPSFLAVAYAGTRLADGELRAFVGAATLLAVATLAVYLARGRLMAALDRVA